MFAGGLKLFGGWLSIFGSKSGGTGGEMASSEGFSRYER